MSPPGRARATALPEGVHSSPPEDAYAERGGPRIWRCRLEACLQGSGLG